MKTEKVNQTTTLDIPSSALYKSYIVRLRGDGQILQIEERVGKKLLRTIDPLSKDFRELLRKEGMAFHMPDGEKFHGKSLGEAYQKLIDRALEAIEKAPESREWRERHEELIKKIHAWEEFYRNP
ncbi:MAG: hypothetical protein AB1756_08865 [Acidobacteriota bacterium]